MVSQELIKAVKLNHRRQYKIAHAAGLHPCTLSQILNGITVVKPGDSRVVALGRVLGLSEDRLFSTDAEEQEAHGV